jgi:hypothetical protein
MQIRKTRLLMHPEFPGIRISVTRWFWEWWYKPHGFATYEEVFEYYAKCKRVE